MTPAEETQLINHVIEEAPKGSTTNDIARKLMETAGWKYQFSATKNKLRAALSTAPKVSLPPGKKPVAAVSGPVTASNLPFKRGKSYTYEQAANLIDRGPETVRALLVEAKQAGLNVVENRDGFAIVAEPERPQPVSRTLDNRAGFFRFGAVSDNHMGSRYERLDVLHGLYDTFAAEGIKTVYNAGNWIDGEARFNVHDLNVHGLDRQLDYMIAHYPQREGIITEYIGGDDHEGWYTQKSGVDVGALLYDRAVKAGRHDLKYLGYMENDIVLTSPDGKGKTVIKVMHPGGGSSYAISYTSQKIVESFSGAEKPDILLIGHYHKAEYLYTRGVHVIQTGCTQDQSPFMRKKRLSAHLGGWIIEFSTHANGAIDRIKTEFFPYYDRAFHKWEYKT